MYQGGVWSIENLACGGQGSILFWRVNIKIDLGAPGEGFDFYFDPQHKSQCPE